MVNCYLFQDKLPCVSRLQEMSHHSKLSNRFSPLTREDDDEDEPMETTLNSGPPGWEDASLSGMSSKGSMDSATKSSHSSASKKKPKKRSKAKRSVKDLSQSTNLPPTTTADVFHPFSSSVDMEKELDPSIPSAQLTNKTDFTMTDAFHSFSDSLTTTTMTLDSRKPQASEPQIQFSFARGRSRGGRGGGRMATPSYRQSQPTSPSTSTLSIFPSSRPPTSTHPSGHLPQATISTPSSRPSSLKNALKVTSVSISPPQTNINSQLDSPTLTRPTPLVTPEESASTKAPSSNPSDTLPLPQQSSPTTSTTNPTTFFTFRAQLTFRLPRSHTGVNVAHHFNEWANASFNLLQNFSLLPFHQENGQQITDISQLQDDKEFYSTYFHNHRVLQHGNLTGMIHFTTLTPWNTIKKPSSKYFTWLHQHEVFLNYTKFKTDTLVPCGFLLGAHPSHLRRNEAEEELRGSLGLEDDSIPFQLASRQISVPISEGSRERFAFQAVVVETATASAATLRERFYELENPSSATLIYPYTGGYQFVPMLKSKEWPIEKILKLAKIHVAIVQDLHPLYLENLQDIHHVVNDSGDSLLQGFASFEHQNTPVFHSMHNMGLGKNKVLLVNSSMRGIAIEKLGSIHEILHANIPSAFHPNVFTTGRVQLTNGYHDSISACNYSAYANDLISTYSHHISEASPPEQPKRPRIVHLSYSSAVSAVTVPPTVHTNTAQTLAEGTIASLTSKDVNDLFHRLQPYISSNNTTTTASGITIEELDSRMQESQREVLSIREGLNSSINDLSSRLETISTRMERQNSIILNMEEHFRESLRDFSIKLRELYELATKPSTSPAASTSKQVHWGSSAP